MPKRRARIEVYIGKDGRWRWRLVAGNLRLMINGLEGYSSESACKRAVRRVTLLLQTAPVRVVVAMPD
jgi:uncharacterized protein YegP (UPF0339 family)